MNFLTSRDPLYNTVNGVTKILLGCCEETGDTEDGKGVLIVEAEGSVVY